MSSINTSATEMTILDWCREYFFGIQSLSNPLNCEFLRDISNGATRFGFQLSDNSLFVGYDGWVEYPNGYAVSFRKGVFVDGSQIWECPSETIWAGEGCWEVAYWHKSNDSWEQGIEGYAGSGYLGPFADEAVRGECLIIRDLPAYRRPIRVSVRRRERA